MNFSEHMVNTLCGRRDLDMAIESISSLQLNSPVKMHHRIFSDGSICDSHELFSNHGISCTVISKEESDDFVNYYLKSMPLLCTYRQKNPLIRKAVDIPLMSLTQVVNMADTDVYALKSFTAFFDKPRKLVFNRERRIALSARWASVMRNWKKFPLAYQLNSGIYQICKSLYDLDFVNYVLEKSEYFPGSGFLHEQTIWACIAGRFKKELEYFDRKNVAVITTDTDIYSPSLCIGHFIRPYRYRLSEVPRPEEKNKRYKRVHIGTHNGKIISPINITSDRLSLKLGRHLRHA